MREGEPKSAIDVFKLVVLAYPESADANENLAEAYLAEGQKELARQHAEKALAILDSHRFRHHHGQIRSSTAARFVAVRKKFSSR